MSKLCIGENFSEELTCAVCLDSWKDPVELQDCKHVFCRECIASFHDCPQCRASIKSTATPNRALVNLSLQVPTKCIQCGWKGTREQSAAHVCAGNSANKQHFKTAATDEFASTPSAAACDVPLCNNTAPNGYDAPYFRNSWGRPNQSPGQHSPPHAQSGLATSAPTSASSSIDMANSVASPPFMGQGCQTIFPTGPTPWKLYGMSQDEYDQIVSLFVFFDSNESGTLSCANMTQLARWLNFARTDEEICRILAQMDVTRRGQITLPEFMTWLRYNKPNPQSLYGLTQSQYNTIMMQFHVYDRDRSGFLNEEEFIRLVLHIGDVENPQMGRKLFKMIDANHDGKVNLHEFLKFRLGNH